MSVYMIIDATIKDRIKYDRYLELKRENRDLKAQNFAPETMPEFIRDTIAIINGIYYVMPINPDLISDLECF